MKAITIALLLVLATFAQAENWAVIVAGSNQFYNYRHQADVCHAYQIVVKHGINPANIIVMSYNDAANSPQNPYKGKLFNKPTGSAVGVDVNAGCMIDYEGKDVTPENFVAVLTGGKPTGGNGKVLKSTANDNVFINFVDHGAEGLIAFPSKYMYEPELIKTLTTMKTKQMYKQLTFYLETCESGSMFINLPKDTSVYAVSAANPTESSWGTYCPPDDIVGGKHIGSCLGDLFSVNWMEDTDAGDVTSRTLQEQFVQVQKLTAQSHVMQWGDLSFTSSAIGEFLGKKKSVESTFLGKVYKFFQDAQNSVQERSWDQRDAKIQYLLNRFNSNPANDDTFVQLTQELEQSKKYASMFKDFSSRYQVSGIYFGSTNFECYETLIPQVEQQCGIINDQSMGLLKYLYQYCGMYTNWQNATFSC